MKIMPYIPPPFREGGWGVGQTGYQARKWYTLPARRKIGKKMRWMAYFQANFYPCQLTPLPSPGEG
jgi:hypothetical protein